MTPISIGTPIIKKGKGGGASSMPITYAELKALRDAGGLTAGMQYRITDYECTTAQENTKSAGHQFDIIVTADSESVLNESARAIQHEGDTYFKKSKLAAWELKYSLNNDMSRFAWAKKGGIECMRSGNDDGDSLKRFPAFDGNGNPEIPAEYRFAWGTYADEADGDPLNFIYSKTEYPNIGDDVFSAPLYSVVTVPSEGKGVIYWMKDEWNNECPYDFKNILFKRRVSLEHGYPELDEGADEVWVYTFSATSLSAAFDRWSGLKDGSLESPFGHQSDEENSTFWGNIIKPYRKLYDADEEKYFLCGEQYLNNIVFLGYYLELSYDIGDYNMAFCAYGNVFGDNCYNNTFGYDARNNVFGYGCYDNTFGASCIGNVFGDNCYGNVAGNCLSNSTFGSLCENITIGRNCSYISFGKQCAYNTIGDYSDSISFGNGCSHNSFRTSGTSVIYYCFNIVLGDGVSDNIIGGVTMPTASKKLQNIRIAQGLRNKTIQVATGLAYETYVGLNSSGSLVTKCLLDSAS